jgi:phospholipase/lecithinase/hemolysin
MTLKTHITRGIILAAALTTLFACGSSDSKSKSIVAFGDSLTDGGTYKNGFVAPNVTITAASGGGRFTTNGPNALTWAEVLAKSKGLTLNIAGGDGFSQTYAQAPGGTNYAQGGSRVKLNPGSGNDGTGTTASALDVTSQVGRYITANSSFNNTQLVLLSAGANYSTNSAVLAVVPNPQPAIIQAAKDLATLAKAMQAKGAVRLVIANLPDMGKTPAAVLQGQGATLTGLSNLFNSTLSTELSTLNVSYVLVDSFTWINTTLSNAAANGITNTSGTACNIAALPGNSSLFCGPSAFVATNADMTYAFADLVHPTTKMHQLYGAYALGVVNTAGW